MPLDHTLLVLALFIPLVIDTFVLSTALGLAGLPKNEQTRTSLILAAFEGLMPAVGVLVGQGIGHAVGNYANYIAAAAIGIAGLLMLLPRNSEAEEEKEIQLLARARGLAIINLGLSISIDELAIGLSLGLLHVPLLLAVIVIGVQAFLASRLGFWLGGKLSERLRENAEKFGGWTLVLVAVILVITKLTGHHL